MAKRKKQIIPNGVESLIKAYLPEQDYQIVLGAMEESIRLETSKPPLLDRGKTKGDWNASLPDFTDDYRPPEALSFEVIDQMLKSAPVRFALEMKRSQVVSIFRNERSWKVHSPDPELAEIVEANLRQILPKTALDFSYSSLVYGASFQELVWEFKSKYELGITDSKYQSNRKFAVAKIPNSVNPETVEKIKRDKQGHFNGFVQRPNKPLTSNLEEINVARDSALVIPYNERFRNLWGESFLKPMYPIWFWYEVVMRSMVRYMERTGTPVAVVKAPSRATVIKPGTRTKIDGISWGMEIASNVSRSNAAVIPSDTDENGNPLWELSYLSSQERAQPFMDILELLTQMILRAGLSADRAISQSSGGVGSYSIGEIHKEATALHNEMILIQWVHYLNTYLMPLFSLYNRGKSGPPVWIETQGLDPTDRDNLKSLLGVAANIESFKDASYRIDWETLLHTNNFPLLSEEEAKKLKDAVHEEAMAKQEDSMEVANKFAKETGKEGAAVSKGAPKLPRPGVQKPPTPKLEEAEPEGDDFFRGNREKVALAVASVYFDNIKLFNPYHDSLGRFASKSGSAIQTQFENSKGFIRKHKREIVAGGAILAAVGIASYTAYQYSKDGARVDSIKFDKHESKVISPPEPKLSSSNIVYSEYEKPLKQEYIDRLNSTTVAASKTLNDLGIEVDATVNWYTHEYQSEKAFKAAQRKHNPHLTDEQFDRLWEKLPEETRYKTSTADPDSNEVHITPGRTMEAIYSRSQIGGIAVVAHELFHTRKSWIDREPQEEGLSNIYESLTVKRIQENGTTKGKPTKKDLDKNFWEAVNVITRNYPDSSSYSKKNIYSIFKAASHKYRQNKDKYSSLMDVIHEWATVEMPPQAIYAGKNNNADDMFNWMNYARNYRNNKNVKNLEHKEEGSIQLFNPYHDALGRFTTATGAAGGIAKQVASNIRVPKSPIPGIGSTPATEEAKRFKAMEDAEYREAYAKAAQEYKGLLSTPAEYIARKKGLGPKLARTLIDAAPETAYMTTMSAGVYSSAALLGGLATGTVLAALFGSAPTSAVIIGGLLVGTGANIIINEVLDHYGDKALRGYLNRYAPQDKYHVSFTKMSNTKKGFKIAKYFAMFYQGVFQGGIAGSLGGIIVDSFGSAAATGGVVEDLANLKFEDEKEPGDIREFVVTLQPFLAAMAVGELDFIRIPDVGELHKIPGFIREGTHLELNQETLHTFMEAYNNKTIPEIQTIEFGNVDIQIDPTKLEANYQLFNPYHDQLGRFAPKASSAVTSAYENSKGFIARHKREIIAGGAILAAVGVAGYTAYQYSKSDGTQVDGIKAGNLLSEVVDTSKKKIKEVEFGKDPSNPLLRGLGPEITLTQSQKDMLNSSTISSEKVLNDFGFDTAAKVTWHQSAESFQEAAYEEDYRSAVKAGKTSLSKEEYRRRFPIPIPTLPAAFATEDNSQVHMSNGETNKVTYSPDQYSVNVEVVNTAVHELFHTRKNSSSGSFEESLSTMHGNAAFSRMVNGRQAKKLDHSDMTVQFWNSYDLFDSSGFYGRDNAYKVFRAAAFKYRANKDKYESLFDVIHEWSQNTSGMENDYRNWLGEGITNRSNRKIPQQRNLIFEESVQLFNPYHDELGRFASKSGNASHALKNPFGGGGSVEINKQQAEKTARNVFDRTSRNLQYGTPKVNIKVYSDWNELQRDTGISSKSWIGGYTRSKSQISITPLGAKLAAGEPKYLDRIMVHETVHARKRSLGRDSEFFIKTAHHMMFEEGLTEIISFAPINNKSRAIYQRNTPYARHMQAVAREARRVSGNDRTRAWQWITESHYRNDNWSVASNRFDPIKRELVRGTGTWNDVDWLYVQTPRKLEEEIDDEKFADIFMQSEKAFYESMGIDLEDVDES